MNKLIGFCLILLAIALGLIAIVNLLALISMGMDGQLDIKYGLIRIAIVFVTGFSAQKSFMAGKQRALNKSLPSSDT